jgi:hypothetical protein
MSSSDNEVDRWYDRDPRRRAAEVDFGDHWTSAREPAVPWRVSWNSGTGELFAARRDHGELQVLGLYPTADVAAVSIAGWAQRALGPGGLDWLREVTSDFGIGAPDGPVLDRLDAVERATLCAQLTAPAATSAVRDGVELSGP